MKQNQANRDVRQRAANARITLWQIAERAGISDTTLCKWMRTELKPADPRRILILAALKELEQKRTGQDGTAKDGNANDHGDS